MTSGLVQSDGGGQGLFGRMFGGGVLNPVDEAEEQRREDERARAERLVPELALDALDPLAGTGWLTDGEAIYEWVPPANDPMVGGTDAYVMVGSPPEVRFLRRPHGAPASLAAWRRGQEIERREREAAVKARAREIAAEPWAVASLADLERRPLPSLRRARELIERYAGELAVHEGRLRVRFKRSVPGSTGGEWADAVRVLHLAEPDVVRLLDAGAPFPDCQVTPAGALIADA
jgi:hypothetical protein